jgi:hypothetical protein
MDVRQSFGLYLETAGPGEAAHAMTRRHGVAGVESLHERWSGRLMGFDVTAEDVLAALGPADEHSDRSLRYALPTRPGYRYAFQFSSPGGGLRCSGFVRNAPISTPIDAHSDPATLIRTLAEVGATSDELRSWLGEPTSTYGWWPIEMWEYEGVSLQLRHGVVESPDAPADAVAPVATAPEP